MELKPEILRRIVFQGLTLTTPKFECTIILKPLVQEWISRNFFGRKESKRQGKTSIHAYTNCKQTKQLTDIAKGLGTGTCIYIALGRPKTSKVKKRTARTSTSKEPQQRYRLGTVSIKILGGA